MSNVQGPEDLLTEELLEALQGVEPKTDQWKKGAYSAARTLDPGYSGSCNMPLLGAAVRLLQVGDNVADWTDFFAASAGACMGIEAGSRIYLLWHILSVAALARTRLRPLAMLWLSFVLGLFRQMLAPDGRLLLVGQRSAGHPPNPGLLEWFAAQVFELDVARAEMWCRQNGVGLKQKWEYDATRILLDVLRDAAAMAPVPHTVLSPYHFAGGDGWQAVWTEKNLNPNTPPVLGVLWTPGRVDWLPANGGAHIREQFDHATCTLDSDGRVLRYESSLYGSATLAFPTQAAPSNEGETPAPPAPAPPSPPSDKPKGENKWTGWL